MWQGVGSCGRVWGHVTGGGGMLKGEGWGHVGGVGAYDRGKGGDMWQGLETCGRVWGHVAEGGAMRQVVTSLCLNLIVSSEIYLNLIHSQDV